MTGAPGDNLGVTGARTLGLRLVVVALLAVGLVGMHHLVVVACHHVGSPSAGSTAAIHGEHPGIVADDAARTVSPVALAPQPLPDEVPTGALGVAATCLAILLTVLGLVLPRLLTRISFTGLRRAGPVVLPTITRALRPPDLTLLSVSRT